MKQCQYWINHQHRCPEQALPGSDFCRRHQVHLRALSGSGPSLASWKKYRQPTAVPARPGAVGREPEYPGLFTDQRNILVGKECLIYLGGDQETPGQKDSSPQLLLLLANLSLKLQLAGQVEVYALHGNLGFLVKIIAPEQNWEAFSSYYDYLATAAGISDGHLYVGEDPYYICYRDWQSLTGYDAAAGPVAIDTLMLTDKSGQYHLPARDFRQLLLADLIMSMNPVGQPAAAKMTDIYFFLPRPLYPLVGRYLRNHHLRYKVSSLVDQWGARQVLLSFADCQGAESDRQPPRHVLSFLSGLPGCQVFHLQAAAENRRLLVSWDFFLPGKAERLLEVFPPDTLLLFSADPAMAHQCISPAPVFFDDNEHVNCSYDRSSCRYEKSTVQVQELQLSLPLRLVHDARVTGPTEALLLDDEEMDWFARFLYRLPARIFTGCRIFRGQGFSVLLGDGSAEIKVPFGLPLRRVLQGNLLIPRYTRITPEVSWPLLAAALGLSESRITILTDDRQLEFPLDGFMPLSRSLVAGVNEPAICVEIVHPEVLPEIQWNMPEVMVDESAPVIKHEVQTEVLTASVSDETRVDNPGAGIAADGEKHIFRQRAESLRLEGDYLKAGVCFALAEMPWEAGRCYRDAALEAEKNLKS